MLSEADKHYGEGIIKEYSKRLTNALGKGYTFSALTRMRKLYAHLEKVCDSVATIDIWQFIYLY